MAARSNHEENAMYLLRKAQTARESASWQSASAYAEAAQAEATLALVEQQRIASTIALGSYSIGNDLPPFRYLVMQPTEDGVEIKPSIREGLQL